MRVQIAARAGISDGRQISIVERVQSAGYPIRGASIVDIFIVEGVPSLSEEDVRQFLSDQVAQQVISFDSSLYRKAWSLLIEVAYLPGVADPVASTIRDALSAEMESFPGDALIQTARQILIRLENGWDTHDGPTPDPARDMARLFHNPLVQQAVVISRPEWDSGSRPPNHYPIVADQRTPPVQRIDVSNLSDEELDVVSKERLLALNGEEMRAIRHYYDDPEIRARRASVGLGVGATDVELEMIAQTWSEHCKHKIFAAHITYTEEGRNPEVVDGLFKTYIRGTTNRVAPDTSFVKSAFHDNAGVIAFDEETLLCFKAETHNSPSALDPYGGAITGIVGVNRDILGTGKGARPIFNTDVLCFGHPETPADDLPKGLLHPRAVLRGVHRGIVDGGNQSGIPVAAGAFLFDESYIGKPLVFCGTGGILPASINGEASWIKHVRPGHLAVMVGGRIGKDGIHGATFSSLLLDRDSPISAVQIGEPITQRKMADFLLEARDAGLYSGITDNGAGGLSSSLGEMARDSRGVEIDLDACPLKYDGLSAWEILLSESQERMTLSVDMSTIDPLLELASRRGVEVTVIGRFTDDGQVRVLHAGTVVGEIELEFLHDGLPQMRLKANWTEPPRIRRSGQLPDDANTQAYREGIRVALLALLADPNIASKEHLIRQYDHEVQGGSIVKPTCGREADGPTDGAVMRPRLDSWRGITVTHGINPRYGDADTYHMATASVDEAVRAHVALGGDPEQMSALDNFCWPDPVLSETTPDGPAKLALLVRACRGLADACIAYDLPLISGKDSMKNDSYIGGRKISVRPTLLVSLLGIVTDVRQAITSSLKTRGDRILFVGTGRPALGGSAYERYLGSELGDCPHTNLAANPRLYRVIHAAVSEGLLTSLHDLSEGGLAVALAEAAIGGRLGARISLPADAIHSFDAITILFGERTGSFIATCSLENLAAVKAAIGRAGDDAIVFWEIGEVVGDTVLEVTAGATTATWSLQELIDAWGGLRRMLRSSRPQDSPKTDTAPNEVEAVSLAVSSQQKASAWEARGDDGRIIAKRPTVLLLTGYGINANLELAESFRVAGAVVAEIHLNDLLNDPSVLDSVQIFGLPGGFSYGDHVGSGLMLARRLRALQGPLNAFRESGRLVLGICNGFQVLTKLGILPDMEGGWEQEVSLVHNDTGLFEDSWVTLQIDDSSGSPWLRGISKIQAPIRHGEGRFVVRSDAVLDRLKSDRRIAARYVGRNPNGSADGVAGIVDRTGLVLGMMPHPEAFLVPQNHPQWTRWPGEKGQESGSAQNVVAAAAQAAQLFRNAVDHVSHV